MSARVPVTFDPPGVTVWVPSGTDALSAARQAGVLLPAPCGGRGRCGKCAVRIVEGDAPPPSRTEARQLAGASPSVRLACLLSVTSPIVLRPMASVARERIASGLTVAPAEGDLVAAIDLGTTTVSTVVLRASDGIQVGQHSTLNPQAVYGADVASRLSAAAEGHADDLRGMALAAADRVLESACRGCTGRVTRIVIAGNPVMTHLALGETTEGLAMAPYRAAYDGARKLSGLELGLERFGDAEVLFVPGMAPFVGGDVTAGIIASEIDEGRGARILLDLGTNAEVALAVDGGITVTSAAAGPAFEGGHLSCGGAAADGAVESVREADGDIVVETVGDEPPEYLCGSGVLQTVATLLKAGHLDPTGKMLPEGPLRGRFHERDGVLAFQVAGAGGEESDVFLTQKDVRAIQLAKAAVTTALELTLESAGLTWPEVRAVRVAGDFGYRLTKTTMVTLGILPSGERPSFGLLGNSSLAGAAALAVDPSLEERAQRLASSARSLDLAALPGFPERFIRETFFPLR